MNAGRARGFTLLELIVVIAIFGVMAAMAYGGLNSVLKTRNHVELSLARTADYQKAFMRLRNDFQEVRNRPIRDNFGDRQPAFSGNRDGRVDFTHGGWRNPLSQPRASLERVFYHYDDKQHTLVRSSYRVLDLAQDSKPVDNVLLDQVEDVSWRYFDSNRSWQTIWPPLTGTVTTAADVAPPQAVELTLHTRDLGELRLLFRLGMDPGATKVDNSNPLGGTDAPAGNSTPSNTDTGTNTNVTPSTPSTDNSAPQADANNNGGQ